MLRLPAGLLAILVCLVPVAAQDAPLDPSLWAGMRARSIGPAGMSGRIAVIEVAPYDHDEVWVGAATGGLWRSRNAGLTWTPVFDDQPVAAIGAVAIHPRRPGQIWVGTGEGNPRNSASVGDGVYRSLDGGRTWTHVGLDASERIQRIVLHPEDPDVAFVAALGPTWKDSGERGVFKTTDGGKTWDRVLSDNATTGCADLVLDPRNPDRLVAALWDHRRWPWSLRSGGPGSGIFVTHDGGTTWERRGPEHGLPKGPYGRTGLAISASDPDVVYALVEAKDNVLARSDDGGASWRIVNRETDVSPRPFYFADLRVDPQDEDRVYRIAGDIAVSDDGGKTFRGLVGWGDAHPDHHAMWIDPDDPTRLWIGNDGGVYRSVDHGETWRFAANLPVCQPYHVRVDMERPYHVLGGMQDNGSWRGPSAVWENGGIRNHHWEEVGFGDGFDTSPDPDDPLKGYAMSQQGYLIRWDLRTGERRDIRPVHPEGVELRFNWNAGFAQDPFEPGTIWFGSQFVHRSVDRGRGWEIVSGDLTTNDPEKQKQAESGGLTLDVTGAENFTTIVTIDPSPVERGVVWVGTDDGRVHVTRDAARSWQSVEASLPDMPAGAWCAQVVADRFDADAAFAVFDDHRRGDWTPWVFRTEDAGATWRRVVAPDEGTVRGYALAIAQDPVERGLWWLGTEFGLWVSLDAGKHWYPFRHGIPTVSCMDLVVHPREHDLVVATHGRGFFVLDDVRPMREIAAAAAKPLYLFDVPAAWQYQVKQTGESRFPGAGEYRGENRPYGAMITFWIDGDELPHPDPEQRGAPPEEPKRATITIVDRAGGETAEFEHDVYRGVNRVFWNLRTGHTVRPDAEPRKPTAQPDAMDVLPGEYRVRVAFGDASAERPLSVLPDPRMEIADADRRLKHDALHHALALQQRVVAAIDRIRDTRKTIRTALARAKDDLEADAVKGLKDAAKPVEEQLDTLERKLWTPREQKGIADGDHVLGAIGRAAGSLRSSWDAPTEGQAWLLQQAETRADAALAEVNALFDGAAAALREKLEAAGVLSAPGF